MREHEINKLNNFVGGWYFDDTSICDKLIQYHQNSNKKAEGTLGRRVNKNYKDSTDVMIEDKDLYNEYVNNNLQKVIDEYRKKYIFSDFWKNKRQKCGPEHIICSVLNHLKMNP
jgi:hypothetical protein